MTEQVTSDRSPNGCSTSETELLLQETIHRGSNDLQMIVGLLALQSRRATSAETKQALADAMERVSILADARRELAHNSRNPSLSTALRHVCAALQSQAEPRSIMVMLSVGSEASNLSAAQITTLALVVNELATNAIKHGYEDGKAGSIRITQSVDATEGVTILIDDDGLPVPDPKDPGRGGMGLEIAQRLMASIGGLFIPPTVGKVFTLRVPV